MSTIWTLIEVCFRDARHAEELLSDAATRRDLRLNADRALAGFVVTRTPDRTAQRRPTALGPRRTYRTVTAAIERS